MSRNASIHFIALALTLVTALLLASNAPQERVWSPLLDLTNHTIVTSIDYTEPGLAHVETPTRQLQLFEGLRRLEIDDALYWMNGPLVYLEEEWQIPRVDLEFTLAPLLSRQPYPVHRPFVVVIDPGHGGHDPGAVVEEHYEKNITLAVSRQLQAKLEAKGITAKLTRDDDTFLSLEERPVLARKLGASIFISMHANKASSQMAAGIETFIIPAANFPGTSNARAPRMQSLTANRFDWQNMVLADTLHRAMITGSGAQDRGIKRERFAVLRDAPCPAVLLEIGFMSNPDELANMRTAKWTGRLTDALCEALITYKNTLP
jgi:N-acetylmuramoyl-L-alanine amidase